MPIPMQFANWFRSLPSNQIGDIRNEICEKCGVSYKVFYHWLTGVTPVPKLAQEAIIEIAGEPVLFEKEPEQGSAPENPQD